MATYTNKDLGKLVNELRNKSKTADKTAADTLNKSATRSIKLSIEAITQDVNLQPNYVKSKIKTVARASAGQLRAIVVASERGTLMYRYPTVKTQGGYKVAINRTGGYREIKGARMIRLRGSGKQSLAVRNEDAVDIFKAKLGKATRGKANKLHRLEAKARKKPNGMTPLHSRSINQLFTSVREDIQPELRDFMIDTFLQDFRRYDKA